MDNQIIIGKPIYPHIKIEDWEAPSRVVAQRWVDEMQSRGTHATIIDRWNGYTTHIVVQVAHVVTHG